MKLMAEIETKINNINDFNKLTSISENYMSFVNEKKDFLNHISKPITRNKAL